MQIAFLDAYGYEQAFVTTRILCKGYRPFWLSEARRKVVRREDGNSALRLGSGLLHGQDKVGAREKIPGLKHGRIACVLSCQAIHSAQARSALV